MKVSIPGRDPGDDFLVVRPETPLPRVAARSDAVPRDGQGAQAARVGVDVDIEFAVTKQFAVAIGANNVLDEYPDLSSADIKYFGNLPYDVLQPITCNGAFYCLRTTYSF